MERLPKKLTPFLILLTLVLGIVCLLILPDSIAVHWNFSWQPDHYRSKYLAVFIAFVVEAVSLLLWRSYCSYISGIVQGWIRAALHGFFGLLCLIAPGMEIVYLIFN